MSNNNETLESIYTALHEAHKASPNPCYKLRMTALEGLKEFILKSQDDIVAAISHDFGYRAADDTRIGDILTTVTQINYHLKNLKKWMKPRKKKVGILLQPARAEIIYQPKGVVGIIVPWNYPVFLSMVPLASAIAAGNRVILKLSELTPALDELFATELHKYVPKSLVQLVSGGPEVAQQLTMLPLKHLFFTGSTRVGKQIMKAASDNLIPVTLELGGKSPGVIAPDVDMSEATSRFIFGKTLNSGQTCVAPDYLLCPAGKVNDLVEEITHRYLKLYPLANAGRDITSIVSDKHFERLTFLIRDAESKGAATVRIEQDFPSSAVRKMPLTLLLNCNPDMAVMQEEIFGPLLPIVPYQDVNDVLAGFSGGPDSLSLYLYSHDQKLQKKFRQLTSSGSLAINDASFQVVADDLPFGGIGQSGMGFYHSDEGFKAFSHQKSVFYKGKISFAHLLHPPFRNRLHKAVYSLFIA